MHDNDPSENRQDLDDPIAYRDLTDQLPNEALREELASMTPEEREAYLQRLEELARTYLGPGGP